MSTQHTIEQVRTQDAMYSNQSELKHPQWHMIKYLLLGAIFGIMLTKAEVISWFRIQEMFRLQSFHMYGVIGSAVVTGMISIFLIKRFNIRTIYGEKIKLEDKEFSKGQIYGGLIFGFGWGCFVSVSVCTSRNGCHCCDRHYTLRHCGYLGVWQVQG